MAAAASGRRSPAIWPETRRPGRHGGCGYITRPPQGSPTSWDGKRSFGDSALRGWIKTYQPDVVLSGHVHQSPFTSKGSWADRIGRTWIFNAGHQIGPLPSHVVVDLAAPDAYWISLAVAEVAPLNQSPTHPFAPMADPPEWLLAMTPRADPQPGGSSDPAGEKAIPAPRRPC